MIDVPCSIRFELTRPSALGERLAGTARLMGFAVAAAVALVLTACGPSHHAAPPESPITIADTATNAIGCTNFEDDFWDNLYVITQDQQSFPSVQDVYHAFGKNIDRGRVRGLPSETRQKLRDLLTQLYQTLAFDATAAMNGGRTPNANRSLEILTAIELGDRSSPELDQLQTKIRSLFDRINVLAAPLAVTCKAPTPAPKLPPVDAPTSGRYTLLQYWRATRPAAVYGGLKSLATAYQSCEAGLLPPINDSVRSAQGISVIGPYSDGIGRVRRITDLPRLLRTDYYLNLPQVEPFAASCVDVRRSPLIYNYGGKPYVGESGGTSEMVDRFATLDFFRQAGTGEASPGVDCSAFIYTALATSGLKVKRAGRLKAIDVAGITSAMFNNPQRNGLTCLDRAKFAGLVSLRAGDIIAEDGHVVLVAHVGKDPFGLSRIRSLSQCKVSSLSARRYDFTILQSSPSLGGIGINHMEASTFFNDDSMMAKGVMDHAVTACLAKFKKGSVLTKSDFANVIRHDDSPECLDVPVTLNHESCIESCPVPESMNPESALSTGPGRNNSSSPR